MIRTIVVLGLLVVASNLRSQSVSVNEAPKNNKYPSGKIKYTGKFINKKPVGDFVFYSEEGKINSKVSYKDSIAYAKFYHDNGQLQAQGKYENKLKDSLWLYYSVRGKLILREFYLSGSLEGEVITYHANSKVCDKKNYLRDNKQGEWIQYYPSGKLKLKAFYNNGVLEGGAMYFSPSGDTVAVGSFYKDTRHGQWTFYKGKKLDKKEWYNKGYLIKSTKKETLIKENPEVKIRKDNLDIEDIMPGGSVFQN